MSDSDGRIERRGFSPHSYFFKRSPGLDSGRCFILFFVAWLFEENVEHLLVYALVLGIGFNLKLGVCLLYLSTGKANIHKSLPSK